MRLKNLTNRILTIIIPMGILFLLALALHLSPTRAVVVENIVALPKAEVGRPLRLKIPKIDVDAPIENVALSPSGAMDVPKEPANAGWFELGQRPGAIGSAVIAGHYGIKDGVGSVFDNLHKLRPGDKLYVEDENGENIAFVVRGNRRFDPKADSSTVFDSNDGVSHLNLVTCEGTWDDAAQGYPTRLVVFADKE